MNNREYVLIKLAQWKEGKNPNVKPPNNYTPPKTPFIPGSKGGQLTPGTEGSGKVQKPGGNWWDGFKGWFNGIIEGGKEKDREIRSSRYTDSGEQATIRGGIPYKNNMGRYTYQGVDQFQDSLATKLGDKYTDIFGGTKAGKMYEDNIGDMAMIMKAHDSRDYDGSKFPGTFNKMKVDYMMRANGGSDKGYGDLSNPTYVNFAREAGKKTALHSAAVANGADWYNLPPGLEANKRNSIMGAIGGLPYNNAYKF